MQGHLKVFSYFSQLQGEFTKNRCFLWYCDSRVIEHRHVFKDSIARTEFVPGKAMLKIRTIGGSSVGISSSDAYKAGRNENSATALVRNCDYLD
jgi:hypothetical protein